MNKVVLIGNLTRDPEDIQTQSGKKMVRFTLAISRGETADFVDIVSFDKTAEVVEKYCSKGRKAGVSGYLSMRQVTDEAGKKRNYLQVIATEVDFFLPPKEEATKPKVVPVQSDDLPF